MPPARHPPSPWDRLADLAARAVSHRAVGQAVERAAEARAPRPALALAVRAYARLLGVDLGEAARAPGDFESFDAFFTRRLQPGARPVDPSPEVVVSPCDGLLQAAGPVPPTGRIPQVKGLDYDLGALLGDDPAPFAGGTFATIYLSPRDYHRVHAPVDGRLTGARALQGGALPVNGLTVGRVPNLYAGNVRVVTRLDAGPLGELALVLVGAANVGRLELTPLGLTVRPGDPPRDVAVSPPPVVRRGEDLGAFHLGSTVVLVTARRAHLALGLTEGTRLRMGQRLLTIE